LRQPSAIALDGNVAAADGLFPRPWRLTVKGPRTADIRGREPQSSARRGPARFIAGHLRLPIVRENRSDDAAQWLMTLFLGPTAVVLAGILVGLLLRGTGMR
jgi:hypothetical protein